MTEHYEPTEMAGAAHADTELAGIAKADTEAVYAWALDEGEDDLPTQRLTPRRITALGVTASLVVIALAGAVAFFGVRDTRQHETVDTPAVTVSPSPSVPPPPSPVTMTVTPLPTVTVTAAPTTVPLSPSTQSTVPGAAYRAVCTYLYSQGDQWPDGPYLHRWVLERYPDLPPNQVGNILETAFQDPACQKPSQIAPAAPAITAQTPKQTQAPHWDGECGWDAECQHAAATHGD
ncbi:hypothetical protein [Mycolicibacterium sphagni]|uniref:hypothetical protein n=1 Tax=Mycolicibacterium sphagni TaxID=1786 RepID=UPI0021F30DFA|nr:hypothetical protein [Mycolicibacterium sphagni]MCV7175450.1 hypothetical protein [Mycolicibacterium sphagni]